MKIESKEDAKKFLEFSLSLIERKDIDFSDMDALKETFISAIAES